MADTVESLSMINTGSFLVPEVWAKDIIYANVPNFLFMGYSSKALEATASTVRWAVMGTVNPGGTLSQGTLMAAGTLTISQITASPVQYGNAITWEGVQDVLSFTNMRENIAYIGLRNDYEQAMDTLAYNQLLAGTFTQYGGTFGTAVPAAFSGTVGNADYYISSDTILNAVAELKNRNVPTFDGGRYKAVLHVNQVVRLYKDGTFREIQRYMTSEAPLINGVAEAGWRCTFAGCDIHESTRITTTTLNFGTSGTLTAYQGVMLGQDAFGDGWAQPLNMFFYPDDKQDSFRHKKLTWTALGLVKLLKEKNVERIYTTA